MATNLRAVTVVLMVAPPCSPKLFANADGGPAHGGGGRGAEMVKW